MQSQAPKIYHDYIDDPKASGYRGVHVISDYNGRLIEVQLRTRIMHEWAFMVERVTGQMGIDATSSKGPRAVQDWFQAVSEALALEKRGLTVDETLVNRVVTLRAEAQPYLPLELVDLVPLQLAAVGPALHHVARYSIDIDDVLEQLC